MIVLQWIGAVFRWFAGAVVPMFARPVPPIPLAWFLHVLIVGAAVVGLYYVQPHLRITEKLGRGPGYLKPYWLPALFLLVYALLWSIVWVWRLLAPNQPTTDFPDLDNDWAEVTAALEKAGIGIADTPLYLVFGELGGGGFDNLFRALPRGLVVAGGTSGAASLRVYANRDGIYITVAGASLLGVQERGGLAASSLGGASMAGGSINQSIGLGGQSVGMGQSIGASITGASIGASVGAGGPLRQIQAIMRKAKNENRPLTDDEKRRVRDLSGGGSDPIETYDPARGAIGSVLQNPVIVDEFDARLTHVCGLVTTARWPTCPINGAILVVPASAAAKDEAAQQWGLVARQDLGVAEAALKLRFPVFTLIGGVEDLPGGQEFFERFAADKGGQRLGKGFPLNPEVPLETVAEAVEDSVGWVFANLLPYWTFKLMRVDSGADTRDNADLFRFLSEVTRRGPHMARLVSRAIVPAEERLPAFGGCYLTVFLNSAPNDPRFAREFFKKVESTQGHVAWTDEAFDEDASYQSAALMGYLILLLVVGGAIAFSAFVGYTKWGAGVK